MPAKVNIERRTEPVELGAQSRRAKVRIFFGGSFDPVHIGHVGLPRYLVEHFEDGCVIYVPAGRSPFKSANPTADHHRLAMLKVAVRDFEHGSIWEQELNDALLNQDQPSYWADTWAVVSQLNMTGTDRFLIGADQALSMHRWRRYTEFWSDAIVVLRDDADSVESLMDQMNKLEVWTAEELAHWRTQIIIVPTIDVSSTAIRSTLGDAQTRSQAIVGLDPLVHEYILEHGLYQPTN